MAVYDYVCRVCGAKTELTELKEDARHIVDGEVCGTFRRDWSSVNISRENIRAVKRGG